MAFILCINLRTLGMNWAVDLLDMVLKMGKCFKKLLIDAEILNV